MPELACRSLARARADAEALEVRCAAAEAAEAAAVTEAGSCEAAVAERDALSARCTALEERLSEMRAEQVLACCTCCPLHALFVDALLRVLPSYSSGCRCRMAAWDVLQAQ